MTERVEGSADDLPATESARTRRSRVRVGAILAVGLLAGFVAWLLIRGNGSQTSTSAPAPRAGAIAASNEMLNALAGASTAPIYWAGPRPGTTKELTKTADGRVFIRYLPPGAKVGTETAHLTVGTYPVADAYSVTRGLAQQSGSVQVAIPGGGVAFYNKSSPANVYFADPGSSYQVEVYDPSPTEARRLVSSGEIVRLQATAAQPAAQTQAATPEQLSALAHSLGHSLYWAGARVGTTYELSRSPGDRTFIRYLPRGVKVGSDQPYLTIGTYLLRGAFGTTSALARRPGAVRVVTHDGSVAFFDHSRPTNVFVARPGSNVQVEVYDPTPGVARALVVSHAVQPVG